MNPVFWLLVILALVGVWFILTPMFKHIGKSTTDMVDKAKKEMFDDNENTKRKDN